ncbi:class I SAM-dependent methyltransferase [Leptospira inadai]|nr:class I SAM-dependent methyltransferase [Leptospira inadai]
MPDVEYWDTLFDVPLILDRMKLLRNVGTIVEFGSGYGTFTLPLAANSKNRIIAFEIEKELAKNLKERSISAGFENVFAVEKDLIGEGTSLLSNSIDYVMIFNLLHSEDPVSILKEANRILRHGGIAGLVHWNYDPNTPRGPKMEIRPQPLQIYEWAKEANFHIESNQPIDLPPYHYGFLAYK